MFFSSDISVTSCSESCHGVRLNALKVTVDALLESALSNYIKGCRAVDKYYHVLPQFS